MMLSKSYHMMLSKKAGAVSRRDHRILLQPPILPGAFAVRRGPVVLE
jgi:hypothetical protein